MKLQNRSVVITGSGSGIGRACALAFAKEGARIVVAGIDLAAAEETVKQIDAAGGKAFACQTDVSKPDSVAALVNTTITTYGKIDTLINNAAVQINKTIADTTFEEWTAQMSVNVGGVFLCSKLFFPHLRTTKGSIIN